MTLIAKMALITIMRAMVSSSRGFAIFDLSVTIAKMNMVIMVAIAITTVMAILAVKDILV